MTIFIQNTFIKLYTFINEIWLKTDFSQDYLNYNGQKRYDESNELKKKIRNVILFSILVHTTAVKHCSSQIGYSNQIRT